VRLGEQIAKDMIAVRIGPELRFAVVGSPAYFEKRLRPKTPQDLAKHQCINLRLPTHGGLYTWEFEKNGRALNVRVDGELVLNDLPLVLRAALDGFGLAIVMEDQAAPLIAAGRLVRVLADWCAPFSGYHLYYPSRRQLAPAFALFIEALRFRAM
jgi:DNA-binding transcriptional LysR family regulator